MHEAGPAHSEPRTPPLGRFGELDLLRLAAAVAVLIYHFAPRFARLFGDAVPSSAVWAARYGYLGVDLFFMISGFVITMSATGRTWRSFLVHRAVRLYPSFWLALAATVCVTWWLAPTDLPSMRTVAANLTMLPGYLGVNAVDEVYWTLGVEWKFYGLIALALAAGWQARFETIALAWTAVCALSLVGSAPGWLRSLTIFPYGSEFAFGMLLYALHAHGVSWRRLTGAIVCIGVSATLARTRATGFIPDLVASDHLIVSALVAILAIVFLVLVLIGPRLAYTERLMGWGALTYPIYLLHSGVSQTMLEHWRPMRSIAGSVAWILLISVILWWGVASLVERRLVRWIGRHRLVRWAAGENPNGKALASS